MQRFEKCGNLFCFYFVEFEFNIEIIVGVEIVMCRYFCDINKWKNHRFYDSFIFDNLIADSD
jgi:hypothetical protein